MRRLTLTAIGFFAILTGAYIWFNPGHWYANVPGVAGTGPLNTHFARDVALAFLTSGAALCYAARRADRVLALFGCAWLVLHALFHLWIWGHRGLPLDGIALTNVTGIQLPAVVALWAAATLPPKGAQA